jgi:hypothetical protein
VLLLLLQLEFGYITTAIKGLRHYYRKSDLLWWLWSPILQLIRTTPRDGDRALFSTCRGHLEALSSVEFNLVFGVLHVEGFIRLDASNSWCPRVFFLLAFLDWRACQRLFDQGILSWILLEKSLINAWVKHAFFSISAMVWSINLIACASGRHMEGVAPTLLAPERSTKLMETAMGKRLSELWISYHRASPSKVNLRACWIIDKAVIVSRFGYLIKPYLTVSMLSVIHHCYLFLQCLRRSAEGLLILHLLRSGWSIPLSSTRSAELALRASSTTFQDQARHIDWAFKSISYRCWTLVVLVTKTALPEVKQLSASLVLYRLFTHKYDVLLDLKLRAELGRRLAVLHETRAWVTTTTPLAFVNWRSHGSIIVHVLLVKACALLILKLLDNRVELNLELHIVEVSQAPLSLRSRLHLAWLRVWEVNGALTGCLHLVQ